MFVVIHIFPEGRLNNGTLFYFYEGVAKIHLQSKKPIVPIAIYSPNITNIRDDLKVIYSGKYYINIGKPLYFNDKIYNIDEILEKLKQEIQNLYNEVVLCIQKN